MRHLKDGNGFSTCSREAIGEKLRGGRSILAVTGIGKVNTAAAVTSLLERFEPELLINTGCAGAYRGSGLAVGDLAMATDEVFGDEGVLGTDGWHSLELIGIPTVERKGAVFQPFSPDPMGDGQGRLRCRSRLE